MIYSLSSKEILNRLKKRNQSNKYDIKKLDFHNKIIRGYKILSNNNKRFILIDAEKSFDEIQIKLQNEILNIIK